MFEVRPGLIPTDLFSQTPERVARQMGGFIDVVKELSRSQLVAQCSTLLLCHSHHYEIDQIEAMVQAAMAFASGDRCVRPADLRTFFRAVAPLFADERRGAPADAFSSNAIFEGHNYLVLNGTWRSNASNLQRLLAYTEATSKDNRFSDFRSCVRSLLSLSNAACRRAGVTPNAIGSREPAEDIQVNANSAWPRFCGSDLESLGIERKFLRPFMAHEGRLGDLKSSPLDESPMHIYPLITCGDDVVLAMPTAIGFAIGNFIVRFAAGNEMCACLAEAVLVDYSRWLSQERLFNRHRDGVEFAGTNAGPIADVRLAQHGGEFIQILFVADTLTAIEQTGANGPWPLHPALREVIEERAREFIELARATDRYERGLTLVVPCGLGRQFSMPEPNWPDQTWPVELMAVDDLVHLSRTEDFDVFDLLKINRQRQLASDLGIVFTDDVELFDLVAFVRSHGGDIVQHEHVPEKVRYEAMSACIDSGFSGDLRATSAQRSDIRMAKRADGSIAEVRRSVGHICIGSAQRV